MSDLQVNCRELTQKIRHRDSRFRNWPPGWHTLLCRLYTVSMHPSLCKTLSTQEKNWNWEKKRRVHACICNVESTPRSRDKMDAILYIAYLNAYSWKNFAESLSNTNDGLIYLRIYASLGLNEFNTHVWLCMAFMGRPLWSLQSAQSSSILNIEQCYVCCRKAVCLFFECVCVFRQLNSSPLSATYMCPWIGSALVQVIACHLFGWIIVNWTPGNKC